jgi:hypothetical protein
MGALAIEDKVLRRSFDRASGKSALRCGPASDGRELKASTPGPAFEADHGLIVTRSVTVSAETDWLTKQHRWPGLKGIGKMVRVRETAYNTSTEKPGLVSLSRVRPRSNPAQADCFIQIDDVTRRQYSADRCQAAGGWTAPG